MSIFDVLLVAHLIGDFLFQTSWMAKNKAVKWIPLLTHVAIYTITVSIVAWIGFDGLSILGIALIFVSHIILDRRTFVQWWVRTVMRTPKIESGWLSIVVDQIFHILILALALHI